MSSIEEFFRTGVMPVPMPPESDIIHAMSEPWMAFMVLTDADCRTKVKQGWGLSPKEIRSAIAPSIQSYMGDLRSSGRYDSHELEIAILMVNSLLDPRVRAAFPVMPEKEARRLVPRLCPNPEGDVSGEASPDLSWVKDISPEAIIRLVLNAPSLTSGDQNIGRLIVSAFAKGLGHSPRSIALKTRLASVAIWILTDGGDRIDLDIDDVYAHVGVDPSRIPEVVDSIRGGRFSEVDTIEIGDSTDESLARECPEVAVALDLFAVSLDSESRRNEQLHAAKLDGETDPWVRLVLESSSGGMPSAAACIAGLDDDPENRRHACFEWCRANRPALDLAGMQDVLTAELGDGACDGTLRGLFRKLLGREFQDGTGVIVAMAGQSGIAGWYESLRTSYSRSIDALAKAEPGAMRMVGESASTNFSAPIFDDFRDILQNVVREHRDRLDLRDSEREGLGWMHRLVEVASRDGDRIGQHSRFYAITRSADRDALYRAIDARTDGQPRWWDVEIDKTARFRLRVAGVSIGAFTADEVKAEMFDAARDIASSSVSIDKGRMESALQSCLAYLLEGNGSPPNTLVDAFLRIDPDGFAAELEEDDAVIPIQGSQAKLYSPWLIGFAIAAVLMVVIIATRYLGGGIEPRPLADLVEQRELRTESALSIDQYGWRRAGDNWYKVMEDRDFDEYFGDGLVTSGASSPSNAVRIELANEALRRVDSHLRSISPFGIVNGASIVDWDDVTIRFPTREEAEEIKSRSGLSSDISFWSERNMAGSMTEQPVALILVPGGADGDRP
ncbi:MAG: hypothetical protein CMJ34_01910 [Phycisphaerae bacterium]|nr:hypothetical protein [Phycisphaerae bacterium]